jgi:hypothetical protein
MAFLAGDFEEPALTNFPCLLSEAPSQPSGLPASKLLKNSNLMSSKKTKLELTWIGKEHRPRLEPRILLEEVDKSHHAKHRLRGDSREAAKNAKDSGAIPPSSRDLRAFASSREDEVGDIFENRLIRGGNLLGLKALEQEFAGKVKCVFIENTSQDGKCARASYYTFSSILTSLIS